MDTGTLVDGTLLVTTFTTLFVIMDPPGNIPIFLALTRTYGKARQKKAAAQAAITAFAVIVTFAVVGKYILRFLQISVESLQLSGGVLLFLVAMELLTTKAPSDTDSPTSGDDAVNVALVPLGTPLLAGPGAIVAVMVSVDAAGSSIPGLFGVFLAVLLMHVVMWLSMRFSVELQRVLGQGGIMILTKIAGLLLAAIATQMVMNAVFQFIANAKM